MERLQRKEKETKRKEEGEGGGEGKEEVRGGEVERDDRIEDFREELFTEVTV